MKRIIINGRFLTQKITGVQRYARELTGELDKLVDRDELEIAVPPETKEIPEYKNIKVVKFGKLHAQLWENICFPVYVKKKNAISLNLCNAAPIFSPDIVCIHDVRIKVRPKDFSRKFHIWYKMLSLMLEKMITLFSVTTALKKNTEFCVFKKGNNKVLSSKARKYFSNS